MLDQAGGYAGMSVDDLVLLLSADESHRYLLQALGMVERTPGTGYGSDLDFSTNLIGFGIMCMKHLIDRGPNQQSA